jgi:hypothetical protein
MSIYVPSDLVKSLMILYDKCERAFQKYGYISGYDTQKKHQIQECLYIRLRVAIDADMEGNPIYEDIGEIGIYACRHGMKRPILQSVIIFDLPNDQKNWDGELEAKQYISEVDEWDIHDPDEMEDNEDKVNGGEYKHDMNGMFVGYEVLRKIFHFGKPVICNCQKCI